VKGKHMTYEENTSGPFAGHNNHRDPLGWAKAPGFNPPKLFAVLAGFAIFPPLGLGILGYFLWNNRRSGWDGPRHAYRGAAGRGCGVGYERMGRGRMGRSGNTAFDEHSAKVMNDLDEERRAFSEHRAEQRRKRDQEAFDGFQAQRNTKDEEPK
jgi:hypothetical protein